MSQQILVPLDGSTHAGAALPWAMSIAVKNGATVHLVLVHEPEEYRDYAGAHFEDYDEQSKAQEASYLEGVREQFSRDFAGQLKVHHLEGVVQETLSTEAVRLGIDLVVMNVHGWGYTSRALLGSVSDYLVRHLNIPLLLLHAHSNGDALPRAVSFKRVLIPLDGSELASSILPVAESVAGAWQPEFRLVRVLAPPSHLSSGPGTIDEPKLEARRYLETVAGPLRDRGLKATTEVLGHRKVVAAILQEAAARECDLIAMSTHGRGGLSRLVLGSVADKVVRSADIPVLVYQPKQD